MFRLVASFGTWLLEKVKPMQIMTKCPGCGSTWSLDSSAADRRIRCRKCSMLFKIPRLNEVPKAIKVIKHAKSTIYVDEAGKSYG
ncbi:MAG: hypothetical protein ACYTDW_06800 [Planctomycetota bacterium]